MLAINAPASTGPTTRDVFIAIPFSAIAFGSSRRVTSSGMIAAYTGQRIARPIPLTNVSASNSGALIQPAKMTIASTTALVATQNWVNMNQWRRFRMSASAPLGRPRRNTGSDDADWTSATITGDVVSVVINHADATSFIHMQMFDVSQVIHSSRNTGFASGVHGDCGTAARSVPACVMAPIVLASRNAPRAAPAPAVLFLRAQSPTSRRISSHIRAAPGKSFQTTVKAGSIPPSSRRQARAEFVWQSAQNRWRQRHGRDRAMNFLGITLRMPTLMEGIVAIAVAALACGAIIALAISMGVAVQTFSVVYVGAVVGSFLTVCGVNVAKQGWRAAVLVMTSSMVVWAAFSATGLA